jgi:hypothetical protein
MRKLLFVLLMTLSAASARAQVALTGNVFVAPGRGETITSLHFGGDADILLFKGAGINTELGVMGPLEDFSRRLGMFSANGIYHFTTSGLSPRLSPFVTSGFTLAFKEGDTRNLFNVGAGVNYWAATRVGLRFEFRDHMMFGHASTAHYWGVRMGVVLR